jgi:PilZ domain
MDQQRDEGVAYLRSLKHSSQAESSGPDSKPEAAQAGADEAANNDPWYEGTNKRRGPRFKCEGSAEIREEGCNERTWVTFTDVGLNGCYVEAQATYPAGTILNMKLEANGIRVETRGNVRVNYPYLGMGIAFVGMTDENVLRLRQMLASISRGSAIVGPGIPSTLSSTSPLDTIPNVSDPDAALQELIEFFESRQMLMREDFVRILRKSQPPQPKP